MTELAQVPKYPISSSTLACYEYQEGKDPSAPKFLFRDSVVSTFFLLPVHAAVSRNEIMEEVLVKLQFPHSETSILRHPNRYFTF